MCVKGYKNIEKEKEVKGTKRSLAHTLYLFNIK